jgi:hypothetical protein
MVKKLPLIALALIASTFPLEATKQVFELNPDTSAVIFTLGSTLHTVDGIMRLEEGVIHFDLESGEVSLQVQGILGE